MVQASRGAIILTIINIIFVHYGASHTAVAKNVSFNFDTGTIVVRMNCSCGVFDFYEPDREDDYIPKIAYRLVSEDVKVGLYMFRGNSPISLATKTCKRIHVWGMLTRAG